MVRLKEKREAYRACSRVQVSGCAPSQRALLALLSGLEFIHSMMGNVLNG